VAWLGEERGAVGHGQEPGMARLGMARLGEARHGTVWRGRARNVARQG
jgi:hypothetical protein